MSLKTALLKQLPIDEYRPLPFWSWNGDLQERELVDQVIWIKENGFGGYFMHARGGLQTDYLSKKWFDCIDACVKAGRELGMQSWAYDENGWPSGFVGGKLLEKEENRDCYLTYEIGEYDSSAYVSYKLLDDGIQRIKEYVEDKCINVYLHYSLSTVDILNPDVVEQFIEETHQKYKEALGEDFAALCGFFTDEPQYFRSKHPFTKMLLGYFADKYQIDLLDCLGLMFVEKGNYRDIRYKYWKSMQELMLCNFARKIFDWCSHNNLQLTGHYIEETLLELQMTCCAGIMPFYEYMDIPGIDKLKRSVDGPIASKQVSSVAMQLGKKKVLTETFAMCGWDVTPSELKTIAEAQYVNGVNIMCHHLLPYAEHGQRKRDYPAHFSWFNPWVKADIKTFNDYFATLGALLGESKEIVNVGVFCPLRSAYFDYKRGKPFKHLYQSLDKYYVELTNMLSALNVGYHIIDETILARHGRVEKGRLIIGECEYDYVVFPKIETMDQSSEIILNEFYSSGGKMLFTEGLPSYIEGIPHRYGFNSNTSIEEIVNSQPYRVLGENEKVHSTLRELNGLRFLYVVNTDFDNAVQIKYAGEFESFIEFDLEDHSEKAASTKLMLEAKQSKVLILSDQCYKEERTDKKEIILDGPFEIIDKSKNYLTLDMASYSKDGISYTNEYHVLGILDELLNERYEGVLYLKYQFNLNSPQKIEFYTEDMNIEELFVNGQKRELDMISEVEKNIFGLDITKNLLIGKNEVVIKIHYYQKPGVYYALFTDGVTESLKNCLSYDTNIEACYLKGDFGVYSSSGFEKGKEKNTYLAENDFYVDDAKNIIDDLIVDGYPFFSGNVTLKKKVVLDDVNCYLNLQGRFHLAYLKINGVDVRKSYFGNIVDVSEYLRIGENEIIITLYSSNRNLLGPHHVINEEEPFAVRPATFVAFGTWNKGKSSVYRDNYSFVRFGLFND